MFKLPLPLRFTLKGRVIPGRVILWALLVAVVLLPVVDLVRLPAHAQNQQSALPTVNTKHAEFVPGELLVRFRPGETVAKTKGTTQLSILSDGRSLRVELNHFGGSDLVKGLKLARVSPERTLDAIKALRARPDVLYAEPNYIRHFNAVPNDSFYGSQWPLKNSASIFEGGISAESAWDTTTGNQNIVVGVIDSGIDIDHREFGDGTTNTATPLPQRLSGLITVNSPMINPGSGKFFNSVNVTITSPTPGATIHYTTNSSEPTQNDPEIASGGTLLITTNTVVRARAWRPGMFPSGTSLAGFETTAPNGPPVVFLAHDPPAPNLVAALDSVLRTTDPFFVVNSANLLRNPFDPNTRVVIFVLNLELYLGETPDAVTINLTDNIGDVHNVPAEDVRPVPGGLGFAQVTFRLPDDLHAGRYQVKVVAHNLMSNIGAIRIG